MKTPLGKGARTPLGKGALVVAAGLALPACGDDSGDPAAGDGGGNSPPALTGAPPLVVTQGATYSFTPEAGDPDGDALIFGIDGKPAWLQFDTGTGALVGVPGREDAGTYRGIVIWVSDGDTETLLEPFDLTVEPLADTGNVPPTISGTPSESVVAGSAYAFVPESADEDGDMLNFAIENAPDWADFDAETGGIVGTPSTADVGSYEAIVISVGDGESTVTLPPFDLEVVAAGANAPPEISGTPASSATAGEQYDFAPTASDPDGDPLTFGISNAPSWASFSEDTGRLTGAPGNADAGDYENIVIDVRDGRSVVELPAFSISVAAVDTAPTISGSPPSTVLQGDPYQFQPSADGADGDALTFSVANRPSWASFDPDTGRLQGTPDAGDVGSYAGIAIGVSDGEASDTLPEFDIVVEAIAYGTATLSWTAPTERTDGTPLVDLTGYKVYWGPSSGNYTNEETLYNAGLTGYVVEDLVPGTWHFATKAFDGSGVESQYSNEASKTIE